MKQDQKLISARWLFGIMIKSKFLDAIASVGLHMSVGLSVHVLMMEFLTDEHSVRSVSCSLAN